LILSKGDRAAVFGAANGARLKPMRGFSEAMARRILLRPIFFFADNCRFQVEGDGAQVTNAIHIDLRLRASIMESKAGWVSLIDPYRRQIIRIVYDLIEKNT
jgi:hypothetical protein